MAIADDAEQAARKVYIEHLAERFKDDPVQRRHRLQQFDTGHPLPSDAPALKAARETYIRTANDGGTERQATDAARDALYGQFDRERIMQREIDPQRYRKDPEYHIRSNALVAEKVEEARAERQRQKELQQDPTNMLGPKASLETASQQQGREPQIGTDPVRYSTDPNYRQQIDKQEQGTRERATQDRPALETFHREMEKTPAAAGDRSARDAFQQHMRDPGREPTPSNNPNLTRNPGRDRDI